MPVNNISIKHLVEQLHDSSKISLSCAAFTFFLMNRSAGQGPSQEPIQAGEKPERKDSRAAERRVGKAVKGANFRRVRERARAQRSTQLLACALARQRMLTRTHSNFHSHALEHPSTHSHTCAHACTHKHSVRADMHTHTRTCTRMCALAHTRMVHTY
jgi:hypothetical protein